MIDPIDAAKVNERIRALMASNAELLDVLETIEGMYSRESSSGSNEMSLYEACCMARVAIAKYKKENNNV